MRERIETAIVEFLRENHLNKLGLDSVDGNEMLFERGIVDSLSMLQLLTFLESRFDVSFGSEELTWENLSTINKITETVVNLRQGRK